MGETIGFGGLSTTRKCYHRLSNEVRAVKVTKKEDLEFGERKRLLQEIEILKELDHPNVVRLLDVFCTQNKLLLVFELVDSDLKKY